MRELKYPFILLISSFLLLFTSCSLPGWNEDLHEFIETGLSTVYISSFTWIGTSTSSDADVLSGDEITVSVTFNNPKSVDLQYTISADDELMTIGPTTPANTTGATESLTTVSFTCTPSEAAEHSDIEFAIDFSSPSLNRFFDSDTISIRCDSPPDPVENLVAGETSENMACIGFTLPENNSNADISAVQITYTDNSTLVKTTVTEDVSWTGEGLTTVPEPALLDSDAGAYVRYFCPSDVVEDHPYTFSITTVDESGKLSDADPVTANILGTEIYLTYDANGATGTVGVQSDYSGFDVLVSEATSLSYTDFYFLSWNTKADGSGTTYFPGDTFTFTETSGNTTLYAQWTVLPSVKVTLDLAQSFGEALIVSELSVKEGESISLTGSYTASDDSTATVTSWAWFVNGFEQTGSIDANFMYTCPQGLTGNVIISCVATLGDGTGYSAAAKISLISSYFITYDINGATSGVIVDAEFETGETVTLDSGTSLGLADYSFVNWNTQANGQGTSYDPSSDYNTAASLVLFAQWRYTTPVAVTDVSASPLTSSVVLSWDETALPSAVDHIKVEWYKDVDSSTIDSATVTGTLDSVAVGSGTCTIIGLTNEIQYGFRVIVVYAEPTGSGEDAGTASSAAVFSTPTEQVLP